MTPRNYKFAGEPEHVAQIEILENAVSFHPHNVTLSVLAMCVCNPDRSPVGINR
jgi:hypothetical protein